MREKTIPLKHETVISDEQRAGRSPRDDQDEGAARGGEAHLALHPHQAPRPLRDGLRPGRFYVHMLKCSTGWPLIDIRFKVVP